MATLEFAQARACVIERVGAAAREPRRETVSLLDAMGRVLAEPVAADRDFPPLARSTRDGYAVRTSDDAGTRRVIGEVRAGEWFPGQVGEGEAVAIMTGAPLPDGADAVVMVEHTEAGVGTVRIERAARRGDFINPRGSEALAGEVLLKPGQRIGYTDIALMAAVGRTRVAVYGKPTVAILATGDEVVELNLSPSAFQIRNSNSYSLAAQVERAGGVARIYPVARDSLAETRAAIERGLEEDLLLLSGGVSAGKYDVVERALEELGAEFYFDRVRIQPGQPLVFGRLGERFFFGLPGNPASTMVTFELFARAALELLGGRGEVPLRMMQAELGEPFRHTPGLTRFLPARFDSAGKLQAVKWQGSSDLAALARAEVFLVAGADRAEWKEGDLIGVLPK